MNKVFIVGNLVRSPENGVTTSGVSWCKFTVAVGRRFANAQGEREADFLNVTTWRGLAENCGKFLQKGNKVAIAGSIQINAKDGKYYTEIVADDVEFLTPKSEAKSEAKEVKPTTIEDMDEL